MLYRTFAVLVLSLFIQAVVSQPYQNLSGKWRGVFPVNDSLEIPFIFSIEGKSSSTLKLYFLNGTEKRLAGKLVRVGDSIRINIDQFDNEIIVRFDGKNSFNGFLRKQSNIGIPIPVKATRQKQVTRFYSKEIIPIKNIGGTYDALFKNELGKEDRTVGLFKQKGAKLTATFLKVTGDTRFLEGIMDGNKFYLSSFIGSTPNLYKGIVRDDGSLSIEQFGLKGKLQTIIAISNAKAVLPNAYQLTQLKDKEAKIDFSFPNVNGKFISPNDVQYAGKPLIVTMGGTWCPNCMDEAAFLSTWYANNKSRGIEVITIQYETQTDSAYIKKVFTRFKNRFNIQYEQVLGGTTEKTMVLASLPALDTFISFPTILFINRNRKVVKIHTGFSGPATGIFYTNFIKEFNETVDALLADNKEKL